MKRTNKKGFTLVELVIVIAIIAILAAVLIPTFSGVVEKANQSKALQTARNAYTELMAEYNADLKTAVTSGTSVEITASSENGATPAGKALKEVGATSATITLDSGKTTVEKVDFVVKIGSTNYTVTNTLTGDSAGWTVTK